MPNRDNSMKNIKTKLVYDSMNFVKTYSIAELEIRFEKS